MSKSTKSGALTAGLILIAIGVVFFIENIYGFFSVWRLLTRYWPLILILIGVKKLYGYFTWHEDSAMPGGAQKES